MRAVRVIATVTTLMIPAAATSFPSLEVGQPVQREASDLSAAKKKAKKKAAPKEQYLRAVPSEPPPGAKK